MISYIFFILLLAFALLCAIQISIYDFRQRIIPDAYLFPLMLTGLIMTTFFSYPIHIQDGVIGATFGYIMACLIGILFDRITHNKQQKPDIPIGMGDIKLIGVGGLWLGTMGLAIALVIACISGGIWATHHKTRFIPFAPFFLLGGFLSLIAITFLI